MFLYGKASNPYLYQHAYKSWKKCFSFFATIKDCGNGNQKNQNLQAYLKKVFVWSRAEGLKGCLTTCHSGIVCLIGHGDEA